MSPKSPNKKRKGKVWGTLESCVGDIETVIEAKQNLIWPKTNCRHAVKLILVYFAVLITVSINSNISFLKIITE